MTTFRNVRATPMSTAVPTPVRLPAEGLTAGRREVERPRHVRWLFMSHKKRFARFICWRAYQGSYFIRLFPHKSVAVLRRCLLRTLFLAAARSHRARAKFTEK